VPQHPQAQGAQRTAWFPAENFLCFQPRVVVELPKPIPEIVHKDIDDMGVTSVKVQLLISSRS